MDVSRKGMLNEIILFSLIYMEIYWGPVAILE